MNLVESVQQSVPELSVVLLVDRQRQREVHNGNDGQGISHVSWLFSYGFWMPPVKQGAAALLPGNNSAYKRDILLSYAERLPMMLEIDMLLQRQVREECYLLELHPRI